MPSPRISRCWKKGVEFKGGFSPTPETAQDSHSGRQRERTRHSWERPECSEQGPPLLQKSLKGLKGLKGLMKGLKKGLMKGLKGLKGLKSRVREISWTLRY